MNIRAIGLALSCTVNLGAGMLAGPVSATPIVRTVQFGMVSFLSGNKPLSLVGRTDWPAGNTAASRDYRFHERR